MENKYLLELSIKHGLNDNQISKLADVLYQMGVEHIGDERSRKFVDYMISKNMVEMPIEEILAHFRKGAK